MIKAVIIDDLIEARNTLKADLKDYCPDVKIIGEADGVVNGAKLLRNEKPDLVFLDIQMQDGSGFDLLQIIPDKDLQIIFTTASDAYAIKAFRFSAVDYLLKPIDPDELMAAVEKVNTTKEQPMADRISVLQENISTPKKMTRLALNTMEKIHIVEINDIIRCESNVNYTMFYFKDGTKLLVTKTLKEYDELLKDQQFIRVHQSHLVNAKYLKEFVKSDGGYLVMKDGSNVPVSTRKRNNVLEMIEKL